MDRPAYQQRVIDERDELQGREHRLNAFIAGPPFVNIDADEQERMTRQRGLQRALIGVLNERIVAFKP